MTDQLQKQNSNQARRQFWQSHIEEWSLTGLSQIEYCRRNDLRSNRFTYWKRRLQKKTLPIELVQIPTEQIKSTGFYHNDCTFLRLAVNSRFTIEIPDGFTPATLKQVLLTLQGS